LWRRLTIIRIDLEFSAWHSLSVTAGKSRVTATAAAAKSRDKHPGSVVTLPVFEDYGILIVGWLSTLERNDPSPRTATRLIRSIGQTAAEISRVRNSARHTNLAAFMQYAMHSLECSEWAGARYILMMAHALMTARPVSSVRTESVPFRQLPRRAAAATNAPDPATGIVAG